MSGESGIVLEPLPLTAERFAPFGDVIETSAAIRENEIRKTMNDARFERFDDLCDIDFSDGALSVNIARCRQATRLPYVFDTVERHPLGSQAFVPLTPGRFVVVVASPSASVEAGDLRAFMTNGRQGINYHRGTWHMPLIAFEEGQTFLVLERAGDEPNCEIHSLDEAVTLVEV